MTPRKIGLVVEGQTEEAFVRDVLAPHLLPHGTYVTPVILKTKRTVTGHFRGGALNAQQILGDVRRLLADSSLALVSTLIDFYALPTDFPGYATLPAGGTPLQRVQHLEAAFGVAVSQPRFLPHLVLHEFEAWIFSEPNRCEWVFDTPAGTLAPKLERIRDGVGGPENIDEGPQTHPSKRLLDLVPGYRKPLHGPTAVDATGLPAVAARCPHFAAWLAQL